MFEQHNEPGNANIGLGAGDAAYEIRPHESIDDAAALSERGRYVDFNSKTFLGAHTALWWSYLARTLSLFDATSDNLLGTFMLEEMILDEWSSVKIPPLAARYFHWII